MILVCIALDKQQRTVLITNHMGEGRKKEEEKESVFVCVFVCVRARKSVCEKERELERYSLIKITFLCNVSYDSHPSP